MLDAFDLFLNEDEQRVMHGRFATFKVNTVDKLCGMGLSRSVAIIVPLQLLLCCFCRPSLVRCSAISALLPFFHECAERLLARNGSNLALRRSPAGSRRRPTVATDRVRSQVQYSQIRPVTSSSFQITEAKEET